MPLPNIDELKYEHFYETASDTVRRDSHCYIYQIVVCMCVCFAFVFVNNKTLRKLYKQTYRIHSLTETTESLFVLACASLYVYRV